ncbi:Allophanate hydrolase 2 subunit 1 / Allophanate hydrolase 2 subunit 2 [plant metagenome]|uniref:Allophanate hydrolase 2 subunit 1 / Allophanate hydrolase 2 subunit 2 n=1 Tax=plant metagenome TaxID=1297885 RepID=A0A484US63_9ZZZZ
MRFLPVNTHSLLVELADLDQTLALLESLQRDPIAGVLELVPAARTILVSFDPLRLSAEQAVAAMATRDVDVRVERASRLIEIPVDYEGEDLAEVAQLLGVSPQEVVQRHTGSEYTVAFTGFAPGFAYLTGGDPLLNVPRRKTPRTRIPAGAVGLAGTFSGVYPQASPGGWQIIGITPEAMWDIDREPPALLQPGDRVRFVDQRLRPARKAPAAAQPSATPAAPAAAASAAASSAAASSGVEIDIVSPGLQTLTQDLGRPGQAGQGVSASGAMDRQSLRLANRLVGNASDEACLETVGGGLQLRSHGDAVVAVTGADVPVTLKDSTGRVWTLACNQPLALSAGDRLTLGVPRAGARAYVSVRGGWQVAPVLGSRATDTLANVGPAALAAGDRLAVNPVTRGAIVQEAACGAHTLPAAGDTVVLDVCMGPRTDWFTAAAVRTLCEQDWLVTPQSNRVGVRLSGEQSLARAVEGELPSEGTPTGAIQVPPSGQPVLFLADHPLTGGYPVIACVAPYHLDLAGQIPVGARVRFNPIEPFAEWPAPALA